MVQQAHSAGEALAHLSDHDLASLAAWLQERTGKPLATCRRVASKVLRCAFATDAHPPVRWSEEVLRTGGVGRWARAQLLSLSLALCLEVEQRYSSRDGAVRLLLATVDGGFVETVIIPAAHGRDRARATVCLSSQLGCARGCVFCATGAMGLRRQLSCREIVDQFRIAARLLSTGQLGDRRSGGELAVGVPPAHQISNVVFMGMGEPMDNLDEVARAVSLLSTRQAFGVAPSRITVSTVGVVDKLDTFFRTTRAELAVSLNAPDDARRSRLMPVNRRFDLATLRAALERSLPAGRRVLLTYAIFAEVNDREADADMLADYVGTLPCRLNIIPANPGPDDALRAPSPARVERFVRRLQQRGLTALLRAPRGRDIHAACGQLAGRRLAAAALGGEVTRAAPIEGNDRTARDINRLDNAPAER